MVSPTTDRRLGLVGNTAIKAPVTALASGNITQSGQQTVDGVAVLASNSAGVPDRVLCTGMTDATKNGIWDVSTGAWTRSLDSNGNYDFAQGTTVLVNQGTLWAGTYWKISTSGGITIGTTSIAWSQALATSLSASTFTQAGTGARPRDAQTKQREILSLADFYANGVSGAAMDATGVADVSGGFQAAINQAQTSGAALFVPFGNYAVGTQLSVTSTFSMYGAGDGLTFINAMTTTQNVFNVQTDSPMCWRDLSITGKTNATAGALLRLSGSASQNLYSSFINVRFQNGWDQFVTVKAAAWSCYFCKFFSPLDAGMTVENDFNIDGGDMGVFNCDFIGGAVGTAVTQFSAGGMRFHGNKVINWANGYIVSLLSGVHTGDLFINGCSFEGMTGTAIGISKGAGTLFSAIHINDNEISVCAIGISVSPDTGPWGAVLTINDNDIEFGDPIAVTDGVGISLGGFTQVSIHDNKLLSHTSTGGTGIALGTTVTYVDVHDNIFNAALVNKITGQTVGTNGVVTNRNIVIERNLGYNPVGASALSPTASPWTFSNGATRASLSLAAATGITNITINGTNWLAAGTGAAVPYSLELGPNEVAVITYVGALTARQMVH